MERVGSSRRVLHFGPFTADLETGSLYKLTRRVKLQEQPFQVLAALLERPGELITREELRQRLWAANTFVDFDHGLNIAINKLREALGDSAEEPQYIQTLPRRGYRFMGVLQSDDPLNEAALRTDTAAAGPVSTRHIFYVGVAGVLALAGALVLVLTRYHSSSHATLESRRIESIAVLPLILHLAHV